MSRGGGTTTVMHKIPHIWPGFPISGICLISWPADLPAFGTSNTNSCEYHGREMFLKISLRWLLGQHALWQSGLKTNASSHKKDHLGNTRAQMQTYLACWLDSQIQCLITWWDYYHQLKEKKKKSPANSKSICWLMSIQQMPLIRLFSLENKSLLA